MAIIRAFRAVLDILPCQCGCSNTFIAQIAVLADMIRQVFPESKNLFSTQDEFS